MTITDENKLPMAVDPATLPDDVESLKRTVVAYSEEIDFLREQSRLLRAQLYGRKAEVLETDLMKQLTLFDEAAVPQSVTSKVAEIVVSEHKRANRGRRPLPEDLPRVEIVHDIPDIDKVCGCGSEKCRIGEESYEQLDVIPARAQVLRHIRPKYACRRCEGVEDIGPTISVAPPPPQILPKSLASPGLLAHILTGRFVDALPFHRQEAQFERMGVEVTRATMCTWAIKVAQACSPLVDLVREEIRAGPLINVDETTVQVLDEPGREATTKSYMWLFRGGDPARPALEFQYHENRSGDVAEDYLRNYRGRVQTDGYAGYDFLDKRSDVVHAGCWAHVRRKFVEVVKGGGKGAAKKTGVAHEAVARIAQLYAIERIARDKQFSPDEIRALRQDQAVPILQAFHVWLMQRAKEAPPQSLLGKAIAYALRQWPRLLRYTEDGLIRPDNNLAENAIRPFVVGRKNWLFSATPEGARASAMLYSLVETAKANDLDPYWYLRCLFERLPSATTKAERLALLPQFIDRALVAPREWC